MVDVFKNLLLRFFFFILVLLAFHPFSAGKLFQGDKLVPVFTNGESGYACFRIPAIISTNSGKLIAFAEGRKNSCSDTGDIDLVMKSSGNGGKSWGPLRVVWDDQDNTCGNPAPVVDQTTGVIHLLSTWNLGEDHESQIIAQSSKDTRHVYVLTSANEGESWSEPREITAQVKQHDWTWYATGPGSGIQLEQPPYRGRLMVGCDHIEAQSKKYFSHVIYSDDHGKSWQLGGTTPKDQVNECEVAELPDGQLLLNIRNYDRTQEFRQQAFSKDGGQSWENQHHHEQLVEPVCQASLQVYRHKKRAALLFSNPASREKRVNMSLRISYDWGKSWPKTIVLHEGPSAYSDLVVDQKGRIGCLFESGRESPYERIVYSRMAFPR